MKDRQEKIQQFKEQIVGIENHTKEILQKLIDEHGFKYAHTVMALGNSLCGHMMRVNKETHLHGCEIMYDQVQKWKETGVHEID